MYAIPHSVQPKYPGHDDPEIWWEYNSNHGSWLLLQQHVESGKSMDEEIDDITPLGLAVLNGWLSTVQISIYRAINMVPNRSI